MDLKIAVRMIAVIALGAAMTAAVMALRGDGREVPPASRAVHPGGDTFTAELARCRDIGLMAADDAACKEAWAENRRRFLESGGEPRRP